MSVERAIQTVKKKLERVVSTLPKIIGNEAVNWTRDNFQQQGWPGLSFSAWPSRKGNSRAGRQILVKSGRLRRSPAVLETNTSGVVIGIRGVPYARAHNEGYSGTVQVKSFSRKRYTKGRVGSGKFTKAGRERMKTVKSISGAITVKAHSRRMNMPQRKFIGASPVLTSILLKKARIHLARSLR